MPSKHDDVETEIFGKKPRKAWCYTYFGVDKDKKKAIFKLSKNHYSYKGKIYVLKQCIFTQSVM